MAKVMKLDITNKDGLTLATRNKYCTHNLKVVPKLKDATFTENGTYQVPDGSAGYGEIEVNVHPKLESITITNGGTYSKTPSEDAYGIGEVKVNIPLEQGAITSNGVYRPSDGKYYDSVAVNVTFDSLFPIQKEVRIILDENQDQLGMFTGSISPAIDENAERGVPFSDFGVSVDSFHVESMAYCDYILNKFMLLGVTIVGPTYFNNECEHTRFTHANVDYYNVQPYTSWCVQGVTSESDSTLVGELRLLFMRVGTYYVFVNGEPRAKYTVVREG